MTTKCGLLGERLGHSYSKQIHASIAPYEYDLYAVSREDAERMIRGGEFLGLNVTIPYKELAYSLCTELDEFAKEAKSVNTVIWEGGRILGYNTDVFGFISMVRRAKISFEGKNILILGSGGTSKTAQVAARSMGAAKISVCSRQGEVNYENVTSLSDTEIIVNTTPVGMYPKNGASPVSLADFPNCEGVVDVIYNPEKTALILEAESCGIRNTSGLYMLAAQAFRASEIFQRKSLPEKLIEKAFDEVAREMRNIILIGMPGSGKSSIGALVAEKLGREFIDTDEEIEKKYGAPRDIINSEGEAKFRDIETEILAEVAKRSGAVISTGGGIVERECNKAILSQNGKIFLIKRSLESLSTEGRPLSNDITALYERRRAKYDYFADIEIENNSTPEAAANKIVKQF